MRYRARIYKGEWCIWNCKNDTSAVSGEDHYVRLSKANARQYTLEMNSDETSSPAVS